MAQFCLLANTEDDKKSSGSIQEVKTMLCKKEDTRYFWWSVQTKFIGTAQEMAQKVAPINNSSSNFTNSVTNLDKSNGTSVIPEAPAAEHHVILADKAMVATATAAARIES